MGLRCGLHRLLRRRQRKRLEKACEALLEDVDGLDMFDRAVRENVTRATYARFAEHHLHRVEWRCSCASDERRQLIRRAEEPAASGVS